MKVNKKAMIVLIALGLAASVAVAAPKADAERGEALFNDPNAFNGSVSCSQCHPGGEGLAQSAAKSTFNIMGQTQNSLEEAINFCIVQANEGQAIPEDSREMQDMVAYIETLEDEAPPAPGYGPPAPGYGAPGY